VRLARQGFTLLEMVVVLTLVAIITSLAVQEYRASLHQAERAAVAALLQENAAVLERFYSERGSYKLSATQWPALPYVYYPASTQPSYTLAFGSTPRNTDPDYYVLRATASTPEEGYIELLSTGIMRHCVPEGGTWQCRVWP